MYGIEDAYKKWKLRPCWEGEFGEVKGTVDCPYGLIEVHTKRVTEGGEWVVEVTVPMSTSCKFELPVRHGGAMIERAGKEKWAIDGTVNSVKLKPGKYIISVACS